MVPDDIERELGEAAASPTFRSRLAEARKQPPTEAELAAYYAGTLPPEEAVRVGRLAALSEKSSQFLAELDEDFQVASKQTRLPSGLAARIGDLVVSVGRSLASPQQAMRFVGAAAAVAIVATLAIQSTRVPGYPGADHVLTTADLKGTAVLPDGRLITMVDPAWVLFKPRGAVENAGWFVWQPVEGAAFYSLELVGADGSTLFSESEVRRSAVRLPRNVTRSLEPGREYTWILEALDEGGSVLVRGVQTFTTGS